MAERTGGKPEIARLEWAVGALGGLITLAIFGVLGYEAATFEEGPPELVVHQLGTSRNAGGHVVQFEVENLGSTTAAEVVVRARLKQGDVVVEETEATLDYVARRSRREAGVILQRDPSAATLEIAAASYRKP